MIRGIAKTHVQLLLARQFLMAQKGSAKRSKKVMDQNDAERQPNDRKTKLKRKAYENGYVAYFKP